MLSCLSDFVHRFCSVISYLLDVNATMFFVFVSRNSQTERNEMWKSNIQM